MQREQGKGSPIFNRRPFFFFYLIAIIVCFCLYYQQVGQYCLFDSFHKSNRETEKFLKFQKLSNIKQKILLLLKQ